VAKENLQGQNPLTSWCHGRMLDPVGEFGDGAPYPVQDVPKDYPIQVDEEKGIVTVKAGITTRVLLDYLAVYTCVPLSLLVNTYQKITGVQDFCCLLVGTLHHDGLCRPY
jgi:hypothetical protein